MACGFGRGTSGGGGGGGGGVIWGCALGGSEWYWVMMGVVVGVVAVVMVCFLPVGVVNARTVV